jgi:hypothetical protein
MGAKIEITKYMGLKLKRNGIIDPAFVERLPEAGRTYNTLEGYVVAAEVKDKQFDEDQVREYTITLADNDGETDIVDFREGATAYSLIASLANANLKNYIKIVVKKVTDEHQEVYPRITVLQAGSRVQWIDGADKAPEDHIERKEYFNNLFKTKIIERL